MSPFKPARMALAFKGLIVVCTILALELVFLGWLNHLLEQTKAAAFRASHAKQVIGCLNNIWELMAEMKWLW